MIEICQNHHALHHERDIVVRFCSALHCLLAKHNFIVFLAQRGVVVTLCPETAGGNHMEGSGR